MEQDFIDNLNERIAEFAREWRLRDRAVTQAIVYGAPAWETASLEHALKVAGLRLIAVIDGKSPDDYQLPAFCPGKMGDPVKAPRKIVQITATGVENTMGTQCDFMLVALCDDGTVWIKRGWSVDETWYREPDIPQGDIHAK